MKLRLRKDARSGFTLIELLVVIFIIILVLGMSIPVVTAFLGSKSLSNAGSVVRAAAHKSRTRAITTRDIHFLLIFVGTDNSDSGAPITYNVRSVTNPAARPRPVTAQRNTMAIVDENARLPINDPNWLLVVDSMELPNYARFFKGGGTGFGSPSGVIELRFYNDGSLVPVNAADKPSTNLRQNEAYYNTRLGQKDAYNWAGDFDLAISNKSFDSVCVVDFISNTGDVESLVYP